MLLCLYDVAFNVGVHRYFNVFVHFKRYSNKEYLKESQKPVYQYKEKSKAVSYIKSLFRYR